MPLVRRLVRIYIPKEQDRKTELANPRFLAPKTAKQFPPTLVIVSSADLLDSEGKLFGEKLQQAGVDCAIFTAVGQLHDTVVLEPTREGPTPQAVLTLIVETFKLRKL